MDEKLLAEMSLFKDLPLDFLARIAALSKEFTYSKGDIIFREGDAAKSLYLLLSGEVTIRVNLTSRPESVTVAVATPESDSFGWSGLVPPYHYSATAVSETDSTLLKLPGAELMALLEAHPEHGFVVMRRIAEIIGNRLRNSRVAFLKTL